MRFKQRRSKHGPEFRSVVPTPYLYEGVGTLPRLAGTAICHRLVCSIVRDREEAALLAEGFRGVGQGARITHGIWCVVAFSGSPKQPRNLFNLYFDLSKYPQIQADAIAFRIAKALSWHLTHCELLGWLIPCVREDEYPWCEDLTYLDVIWLKVALGALEVAEVD